jgi:hypothetical protein
MQTLSVKTDRRTQLVDVTILMWGRNTLPKTEFGADHWS